jgi:hypothetical protein
MKAKNVDKIKYTIIKQYVGMNKERVRRLTHQEIANRWGVKKDLVDTISRSKDYKDYSKLRRK